MMSFLILAGLLVTRVWAAGPGAGTIIDFHSGSCSQPISGQLANPDDSLFSPSCINAAFGFANNNPAGGWQISNMPAGVSFEVRQSPVGSTVCGQELILQVSEDGCYDLPNLANEAWWQFCETGINCSDPPSKKRSADVHIDSRGGEYLVAKTGEAIPVLRQKGTTQVDVSRFHKRQSTTFTPPSSCFASSAVCEAEANENNVVAYCVDCVNGLGNGASVSSSIDCRASSSACSVTISDSITVTNSIDLAFGVTGNLAGTGEILTGSTVNFGFGASFSVSTTHGQSLGLTIPPGEIGFIQYQPPAVLGTVVETFVGANNGNLCNGDDICSASPGIIASSADDTNGQYSVVITS
jgi:hypothetical protein